MLIQGESCEAPFMGQVVSQTKFQALAIFMLDELILL